MAPRILDLRGLKCPLPALLARRALGRAAPGEEIAVLTDDPMAWVDVPHMCRQEGFAVVSLDRDGDAARMVLEPRGGLAKNLNSIPAYPS